MSIDYEHILQRQINDLRVELARERNVRLNDVQLMQMRNDELNRYLRAALGHRENVRATCEELDATLAAFDAS